MPNTSECKRRFTKTPCPVCNTNTKGCSETADGAIFCGGGPGDRNGYKCCGLCENNQHFHVFRPEDDHRGNGKMVKPKIVATYDYIDESGAIRHRTNRYDGKVYSGDGGKRFSQCRPDGKGGWIWKDVFKDIVPILYHLRELLTSDITEPVFIVEGEKDVLALARLGLIATTNPMGAGNWRKEYNEHLRGRLVILLPDNDTPGKRHMEAVRQNLKGIAISVKIISLPDVPDRGDVSDWINAGGTKHALLQMAAEATEQQEEPPAPPPPIPEPWDDPVPFREVRDLPAFPVIELPEWLFFWVKETAHATQTPPDLAGMLALANIGAALATKFRVMVRTGYTEPTNIFAAVVLNVGERKSEVFRRAMRPIKDYEALQRAEYAAGISEAQINRNVLESRYKVLSAKAAKEEDPNEREKARQELQEVARELAQLKTPLEPVFFVDDISMEELGRLLAVHNERMLVTSPEGTIFEIAKGRYSAQPILDVFLKGHAGDFMRTNRLSRSQPDAKNPALSAALAVQPDVISGLAAEPTMRTRGFLARWFYAVPPSMVGARKIAAAPVRDATEEIYRKAVISLWETTPGTGEDGKPAPHYLQFSDAADQAMQAFEMWLEPRLAPGEELSFLAGWPNKLAGAIARLSGILHMAGGWTGEVLRFSRTVHVRTVEAAIRIGRDYLLPHAKAAFSLMDADEYVPDARRVLRWLAHSVDSVDSVCSSRITTQRDIHSQLFSRRSVEEVHAIVSLLVKRGYLRLAPVDPRRGPGRKPSPRYEVHPSVFEPSACTQNQQNQQNCRVPGEEG
jgi:hypothetical protein